MGRSNGGIIGVDNEATISSASGIWSLHEQGLLRKSSNWPESAFYVAGEYYIICGVELTDDSNVDAPAASEVRMRNALSLVDNGAERALVYDPSNSTPFSTAISECQTNGFYANPDFGPNGDFVNGLNVNGYLMLYFQTTAPSFDYFGRFDTSNSHTFWDISNGQTNLFGTKVPSVVGAISNTVLNGTSLASDNVLVTASGDNTRDGSDNWESDGSDYCFMGVFGDMSDYTSGTDSLDTEGAITGICFGISDSDGAPSSGQPPRLGISRRGSYGSLVTVNGFENVSSPSHAGRTGSGYAFILGKIA